MRAKVIVRSLQQKTYENHDTVSESGTSTKKKLKKKKLAFVCYSAVLNSR